MSLCYCCYKEKDYADQSRYFQIIYTRQNHRKYFMREKQERRNVIRIQLKNKQKIKQKTSLYQQNKPSSIIKTQNNRTIRQSLKRNEQKQCLSLQFESALTQQIRKEVQTFYKPDQQVVVFIEQPICSQRVDIREIYRQVIQGIQSAQGAFEIRQKLRKSANTNQIMISESTSSNKGKGRVKVIVYWDFESRLNQKMCRNIISSVCKQKSK